MGRLPAHAARRPRHPRRRRPHAGPGAPPCHRRRRARRPDRRGRRRRRGPRAHRRGHRDRRRRAASRSCPASSTPTSTPSTAPTARAAPTSRACARSTRSAARCRRSARAARPASGCSAGASPTTRSRPAGSAPRRSPTRSATRPAYLTFFDYHSALVNEPALALAGIDGAREFDAGGAIVVDDGGAPTGELHERPAMDLVGDLVPARTPAQRLDAYAETLRRLNALGPHRRARDDRRPRRCSTASTSSRPAAT